jgi:tetratricopeptide (TPR) repeat protein
MNPSPMRPALLPRLRLAARAVLLWTALILAPATVFAQAADTVNNNYYAASSSPALALLLKNNEDVHLGKGLKHLATRKPYELEYAIGEFHFILVRWPNHPQALRGIFEAATLLKRPQLVEQYSKPAIDVAPDAAPTYTIIAAHLMRNGNPKAAEPLLVKAVELDPNSLNANYNLGLLYMQTKRPELANKHAQKAYALGHPMPGLRKQLEAAGAWKPMPPEAEPAATVPATPGSAPAAPAPASAPAAPAAPAAPEPAAK